MNARRQNPGTLFTVSASLLLILFASAQGREIRNVILLVGDGMGAEHVRAAEYWSGSNFLFRSLPSRANITTHSANSPITDSAASSTAFATGQKVNNGVISVAIPGSGANLTTLLEVFKSRGKRSGLITTTFLTDATPAAFGAHESSRVNLDAVAGDYLNSSRPDLLLGGGGRGLTVARALAAGYHVVTNRAQLMSLSAASSLPIAGLFGDGRMPYEHDGLGSLPHLSDMLAQALLLLENSPNGFFLLVEGGLIDRAAETNDLARCLPEVLEFSRSVDRAVAWAQGRTDTLIMVLADHETGGLKVLADNGTGVLPTVTWSTRGHTANPVTIYASGALAEPVVNVTDNTGVHAVPIAKVPAWYSYSVLNRVLIWADNLGLAGATAVPGDYDGDSLNDLAVYHAASGKWFIRTATGNVLAWALGWGFAGTVPVAGDYNGDGISDLAVYHPASGEWYIWSLDGRVLVWGLGWGYAAAVPVPGDYDGDGQSDLAVYDSTTGSWFIRTLGGAILAWRARWGYPDASPVSGDYDGDGRDDLAVYDQLRGTWYVRRLDGTGLAWNSDWGYAEAVPVSGDYDGDGASDLMVYDASRGAWYGRSLGGPVLAWDLRWGYPGTTPLPGDMDGDGYSDLTVVEMP